MTLEWTELLMFHLVHYIIPESNLPDSLDSLETLLVRGNLYSA